MVKSTTKKPASKVGKPYADLPSLPHARGYWCKAARRKRNTHPIPVPPHHQGVGTVARVDQFLRAA